MNRAKTTTDAWNAKNAHTAKDASIINVRNEKGTRIMGRASQNKTGNWQIKFDNGTDVIVTNSEFQSLARQQDLTYEKIMQAGKPIQHNKGQWKSID
jgi:pectate lyase